MPTGSSSPVSSEFVQYGIEVIELDIGVLVEGLRRAVDKTIENVAHALRFRRLHKDLIDISQQGHLAIPIRGSGSISDSCVVSDSFFALVRIRASSRADALHGDIGINREKKMCSCWIFFARMEFSLTTPSIS